MSQETIYSLIMLSGVLVLCASFLFIFGFLMPRRMERKLENLFSHERKVLDSLTTSLTARAPKAETPPPTLEEFVDLQFLRCERGPREHRQPLDGEWEACFVLFLSAAPNEIWERIWDGLRLRAYRDSGTLPPAAAQRLDAVIHQCRSGAWEPAARELYTFIRGQRGTS